MKTERLQMVVHPSVRERLERLVEQTEASSMTEVLCRALLVYELLLREQEKGVPIILKQDGKSREVWLIP